jgi:hypothetical protein
MHNSTLAARLPSLRLTHALEYTLDEGSFHVLFSCQTSDCLSLSAYQTSMGPTGHTFIYLSRSIRSLSRARVM